MGRPLGRGSWQAPPMVEAPGALKRRESMHRRLWLLAAAALAILAVATSAPATTKVAGTAQAADCTGAAAPFAQAWANAPRTVAARKAKDVASLCQERGIGG